MKPYPSPTCGRVNRWLISVCFVCLFASSGCSTFNRDWKKAATGPPRSDEIQGRWQGIWLSEANGHTGNLRAIITRTEAGKYRTRFHATYAKVLKVGYTVNLDAEHKDGRYELQGEANLGWLAGGIYHYKGEANATNFLSTYRCKHDHGTFQMQRPP